MPSVIRGSDLFDTNTAIGFSTNHDAATGTVTIPSGLEIGTRRLIRKIHPTQGTVTINCTGETFTRAGLASVELNADGDYWLLEKVTATRWELIDGWNTGENANGAWVRRASGSMICTGEILSGPPNILSINVYISLPVSVNFPTTLVSLNAFSAHPIAGHANSWVIQGESPFDNTSGGSIKTARTNSGTDNIRVLYAATCRWYL